MDTQMMKTKAVQSDVATCKMRRFSRAASQPKWHCWDANDSVGIEHYLNHFTCLQRLWAYFMAHGCSSATYAIFVLALSGCYLAKASRLWTGVPLTLHCMASATQKLRLHSQPQNISPLLIPNYTAWWLWTICPRSMTFELAGVELQSLDHHPVHCTNHKSSM